MTTRSRASVRFTEESSPEQNHHKSWPQGVLKLPPTQLDEALSSSHFISQVYNGEIKLTPACMTQLRDELFTVLKDGAFSREKNSTIPSQDFEYPNCLEVYSVLNNFLRSDRNNAIDVNQLLRWAHRDLSLYSESTNILDYRVVIQVLKVANFLFYSELRQKQPKIERAYIKAFAEQAIRGLTDENSSKALIGVCIHLLNHVPIVQCLDSHGSLTILHAMRTRLPTSSALNSEFLTTYRILLRYKFESMVNNCEEWIPLLLSTLFDGSSYIRQQGVSLLNDIKKLNNTVVFDNLYNSLTARHCELLAQFMEIPGEGKHTMAIWTAILMCIDKGSRPLESWELLSQWLDVARIGFSSPFLSAKEATASAWRTAIYLFAFRYTMNTSITKNLAAMIHPIKSNKSSSPVILERFCAAIASLIYLGLRCSDVTTEHIDLVWNYAIRPSIQTLQKHPLGKEKAIMLQRAVFSSGSKSSRSSRERCLEILPFNEVGNLPKSWIKENMSKLLSFSPNFEFWELLLDSHKRTIDSEIRESEETFSHTLAFVRCLIDPDIRIKFDPETREQMVTRLFECLSYTLLTSPRFKKNDANEIELVRTGDFSIATLLLRELKSSDKFDQALQRCSALPSRQLSILAAMITVDPTDSLVWKTGAKRVLELLNTMSLTKEDTLHIQAILCSFNEDCFDEWSQLFESSLSIQSLSVPPIISQFTENPDLLLQLKRRAKTECTELDEQIVSICEKKSPTFLWQVDNTYPLMFRVLAGRSLILKNCGVFCDDFPAILRKSLDLLSGSLPENADVLAIAMKSYVPENKKAAIAEYYEKFCSGKVLDGNMSPYAVRILADLHQNGDINELPAGCELPQTPQRKRALSPPPTSSPAYENFIASSPNKRQHLRPMSPPITSSTIDYSDEICSSPPSSVPDHHEKFEKLQNLRSALTRANLKDSLSTATLTDCQALERLLVDAAIAVRIHMSNNTTG